MKKIIAALMVTVAIAGCSPSNIHNPHISPAVRITNAINIGHGAGVHVGGGNYFTAAHVVVGVTEVNLQTEDGKTGNAKVMWKDETKDVAFLHSDNLKPATANIDCRVPYVGEDLYTIGHPGIFDFIQTHGTVASSLKKDDDDQLNEFIVTQIPAGPGNSGGGVFDIDREVVGIMNAVNLVPIQAPMPGFSSGQLSIVVPSSVLCDLLEKHS